MKIDKANSRHWLYLLLMLINSLIAIVLRPLVTKENPSLILLYGHKLSGNLLALYEHMKLHCQGEFRPIFLTMDADYYEEISQKGFQSALATRFRTAMLIARARAVLTDHGLHTLLPLIWLSDLKFFDVWHAIPFKGFDASDFRVQHRYTECWVPSPMMSHIYKTQYGFSANKIAITGYARTDQLVDPKIPNNVLRSNLGLDHLTGKRLALFAPTWKQDVKTRSLFPFNCDPVNFARDVGAICYAHNAALLMRSHLNAHLPAELEDENIHRIPFSEHPNTEALLQVTHILICDWSSIAFDFILMNRPTIFLDVLPPFRKGFTLGPEHRYGEIVQDYGSLLSCLDKSLADSESKIRSQESARAKIRSKIYGGFADGNSARRCIARLRAHLTGES